MIIRRYLFKEILKVQTVTFAVLLLVFLCQSLIRFIGRAATGETPGDMIFSMVLYSVPSICYLMLPLSLFVGIIAAIGRICSDSEMVVMRSSGYSDRAVLGIGLLMSFFTAVLCALNSLYFMPEANKAQQSIKLAAQKNPRYLPIESGRFVNFNSGSDQYVIYIENVSGKNAKQERNMGNLYVMDNTFLNDSSFTASVSGELVYDEDGYQWLNLGRGNRYEYDSKNDSRRSISFDTFKLPVGFNAEERSQDNDIGAVSTYDLWHSDEHASRLELQWRLAPVFAVFILTMIAVPLSMVNPRQGRFSRLWQAILLYAAYYLLLLAVRNMINAGRIPMLPGLYAVPIIFLIFAVLPFNLQFKFFLKRKKSNKPT